LIDAAGRCGRFRQLQAIIEQLLLGRIRASGLRCGTSRLLPLIQGHPARVRFASAEIAKWTEVVKTIKYVPE
jgi:hypothetical protein